MEASPPDPQSRLEGLRAWVVELDRNLGIRTYVLGAIGLLALAFSIYVVYVLEIVKIANPYQRRRSADDPLRKAS